VLARVAIFACLAGLFAAPVSAQTGSDTQPVLLMPGVTYERDVQFTPHGPVVLNVIEAPKPDGSLYRLEPLLSNGAVVATDRLTTIERSLAGTATVAAVNGDYFQADPGAPRGIVIRDGVLDTPPAEDRSSLGIPSDGALQVGQVAFKGIWRGTVQRRTMTLNRAPTTNGVTLYTAAWGPTTPPGQNVVEDVIPQLSPTRPNVDLTGAVSQVATAGAVPIPPGGAVLVARGSQAPILAKEAPVGTSMFMRLALTPDWSGMVGAIGGGPLLVEEGRAIFRAGEAFGGGVLNPRVPRSAVGQLADGRILLVTTDGGLAGYSVGMTNFELAVAMQRLGAVTAMALGSGPAASMAFDGTLLSRPVGSAEPEVSDALGVLYTGVYAPPLSSTVLSPNGDGVDETMTLAYRLVRPSTVTAAVVGKGTQLVLDSGLQQPGLHSFTFTGKRPDGSALAEGGYRFSVSAVDDQGRSSAADRPFAVNDTLGSLAVAPSAARLSASSRAALTISYSLAHPATVAVTIETRTGIVIRTLQEEKLAAGPQQVVWDGRASTGKLAFTGAYVVRVGASNSIGRVELTAPFVARRG
jgi:flagellar hook assembly protein FlgD